MMDVRMIGWIVAFEVFAIVVVVNGDQEEQKTQQPEQTTIELLMRDKLTHAQAVLGGIVTEDYDKIVEHAEMMGLISRATSWHAIDTDDYRSHSKRFQQMSSRLLDSAKKKNRGAVTLHYLQLTISCIECHQYMGSLQNEGS
jgi:hypothetical protein